jgi:type I restriction enzyme M protein
MNLAIRGIKADLGEERPDTFRRDLHTDLRADFVLANPPFNDFDWFRKTTRAGNSAFRRAAKWMQL